jgi:hypothetical protein
VIAEPVVKCCTCAAFCPPSLGPRETT